MEDGPLSLSAILGNPNDSFMDLDFMEELFSDGCFLEANGSEFLDDSVPISPFDPSFVWPSPDPYNNGESCLSPSKDNQEERQRSYFPEILSISQSQGNPPHFRKSQSHSENPFLEDTEQSKRWWIGPRASTSVMDRLIQALGYIKDYSRDKDVLIQVWVPVNRGGKRVLTTNNQPFSLDLNCPQLAHYREISLNYQFSAEDDSKENVGLPGRVFRSRVPEWTPDVRFFTRDEYPRVGHAQQYDVRGTLAVPVLEQGSRNCLGVIEVVLTTQKIKYRPELENVCKALEAVDLRTSEVSDPHNVKTVDLSYQAALPEILEVLSSACGTHGLPLAQTWVSCILQGKAGCRHSDENFKNCVSPVDSACYVGDPHIRGFHEACSEYHLLKDQGVVGKAFGSNQPCFSPDVSGFSRTDYPLSHHARMFGLRAAVAIRLRSIRTGSADFVLEFFLPVNCQDPEEQRTMLTSLSGIIQNVCRTLRVVTDDELQEESKNLLTVGSSKEVPGSDQMQCLRPYPGLVNHRENALAEPSEVRSGQADSNSRDGITFATNASTSREDGSRYTNRTGEKRRIKAEKAITLEILRQHFAGSLKDAARNLGVCPTTLKRICRQHGIQRWPSRKLKKVGHSLQKIQRVIDSVQGTSGVLQIDSFYSNFPELASPNASKTTRFSNPTSTDDRINPLKKQPETGTRSPPATTSVSPSSSCSQASSSSQCCSSGRQPNSYAGHEDVPVKEEPAKDIVIKRAQSDANLLSLNEVPRLLPRSQSHNNFNPENTVPDEKPRVRTFPRIKVTYEEDTIRFRMQSKWKYKDMMEEISRRFGVRDASGFHLKYLDDEGEWVLLTCDADLEECMDVCHSSGRETMKLSFQRDPRLQFVPSFAVV